MLPLLRSYQLSGMGTSQATDEKAMGVSRLLLLIAPHRITNTDTGAATAERRGANVMGTRAKIE